MAYLKMSELDVNGDRYADSDADAPSPAAATTEFSRASSVLFEYNIKGLHPQTKSVSLFYSL